MKEYPDQERVKQEYYMLAGERGEKFFELLRLRAGLPKEKWGQPHISQIETQIQAIDAKIEALANDIKPADEP